MSEEIHSLLGKYFSGQATEEEAAMVKQWVSASAENQEEFNVLQKIWNRLEEHEAVSFDTEQAWQKVNAGIRSPAKGGKIIGFSKWKAAIAVAASLVLVAAVWWMMSDKDTTRTIMADTHIKEVQLPDGSKVYLRKGATLTYPEPFEKSSRDVTLTGEAFFDVTPDAARPFLITAGRSYVRVVGTSFSVDATGTFVELVVKTGKVNFGPLADTSYKLLITPGKKAILVSDHTITVSDADANAVPWMSKQLVFTNTPLSEVAATLSDYYNVSIILKKEDAAQIASDSITIRFNDQPLSSALNELSLISTYHIQEKDKDSYEISIK
jgi:transmembrane sensor